MRKRELDRTHLMRLSSSAPLWVAPGPFGFRSLSVFMPANENQNAFRHSDFDAAHRAAGKQQIEGQPRDRGCAGAGVCG